MKAVKIVIAISLASVVGAVIIISRYYERSLSPDDWQKRLDDAASAGNIRAMERAIAHGADVNRLCCGRATPLNSAAREGQLEAVQFLISRGADVNGGEKFHVTPLMKACAGGYIEVVKLLLQHGADPNDVEYMNHSSVLDWAENKPEIIKLLKEHGAVIEHPGIGEKHK
jgi:uncharacterized protein